VDGWMDGRMDGWKRCESSGAFLYKLAASAEAIHPANNESSEVCFIIKPGRWVRSKLNRSQGVNVHKFLTICYLLHTACISDRAGIGLQPAWSLTASSTTQSWPCSLSDALLRITV